MPYCRLGETMALRNNGAAQRRRTIRTHLGGCFQHFIKERAKLSRENATLCRDYSRRCCKNITFLQRTHKSAV
jgi:hypothetical protein